MLQSGAGLVGMGHRCEHNCEIRRPIHDIGEIFLDNLHLIWILNLMGIYQKRKRKVFKAELLSPLQESWAKSRELGRLAPQSLVESQGSDMKVSPSERSKSKITALKVSKIPIKWSHSYTDTVWDGREGDKGTVKGIISLQPFKKIMFSMSFPRFWPL